MNVILKETIESLGIIGSEVSVAKGYARNYLLPQGKAVLATPENRKKLEHERVKIDLQISKERSTAEELARRIEDVVCQISVKVSEGGTLYGSVQAKDILSSLKDMEITVDKRQINLKEPIKSVGTYQVPIRLYQDVEPKINIEVIAES
ncbi:MAG: large subunit ribosomal protein L9 [Candidatus Magnetoglobus multicellularis str. Araruama]|uniref:Large ribosomal subunit protein bL9 n=1 Tax=Candidatus Magnetoglobus multicellularis str. Araruama TaxID=890399 RepID=A0A1V1PAD8_9BACT|nr:MAG: large subunit ribosomal protein L9 [Candidatus Magnetoglobus multicellularis str. Araruama]